MSENLDFVNATHRRKIAVIVPSLKLGGMERIATMVANFYSTERDWEAYLVTLSPSEPFFLLHDGVKLVSITEDPKRKLPRKVDTLLKFRQILKTISPDLAISFGSMYNSFVLLALLGTNIPVFVSDRSNPYRNTRLRNYNSSLERHDGIIHYVLRRVLYRFAAGILAQTKLACKIEKGLSGNPKNVIYFPNPVEAGCKEVVTVRDKVILNVGRFIHTKNQAELVEIFSDLRPTGWRLCFLGDGPELTAVKSFAEKLGVLDKIEFKGAVPDVRPYMEKAQIFAFTSLSEGFPNALAEAMSNGLACISYDCVAGPADLITDSVNGYLIPSGDRKSYIRKLKKLLNDQSERLCFSQRARESVKALSVDRVLGRLEKEIRP